jgi:hypothetical protein
MRDRVLIDAEPGPFLRHNPEVWKFGLTECCIGGARVRIR